MLGSLFVRRNTLRNQMLVGFLLVMLVILILVGSITFDSVSTLLKNNAEKHIQQTAVQANGRMESVLGQIDSLTTQVATNPYVQSLLFARMNGAEPSFSQRQALAPVVNIVQLYTSGIRSVELYGADQKRLFPLSDASLSDKVGDRWIGAARAAKGAIVWCGMDPASRDSLLAIRRISLVDGNLATGGYLVVRVDRNVFGFAPTDPDAKNRETMLLLTGEGEVIASSDASIGAAEARRLSDSEEQTVAVSGSSYMMVRQRSQITGWTLLILTPVQAITEGISVLRTAIIVSAGIGTVLFFFLSFLLSTAITRPIFKLIKTMRGARLGSLKRTEIVTSTIEINELNYTYNQMVDNMNELIRLVYEKELLQSRTELKALQAQINPHFLFNTLEALYWSLLEKDEEELASYVVAMSELFRYTIAGPNRDEWVALSEELDHIERYLLIMKMRLEDRLTWRLAADPAVGAVRVPKLLLQPLVENAILHGVEGKIGPGSVTVSVERTADGDELTIAVEDDGAGMDEATVQSLLGLPPGTRAAQGKKSGVGIANVRQRVRLCYPEKAGAPERVAIRSRKGEGTRVSITIPIAAGGAT